MLSQLEVVELKDQTKFILDLSMTALRQFVVFTIDVEDELAAYNIEFVSNVVEMNFRIPVFDFRFAHF
jgi:hypothetical protein